jgi:hypothetical protein
MSVIVVSGALANRPGNAGGAAVRTTWVEGLRRLGFEVWFVEQLAQGLVNGERECAGSVARERSPHVRFFRETVERAGLYGRASLLHASGGSLYGPGRDVLEPLAAEAALLVNLGGHLTLPWLIDRFRRKVWVDLDPGFTQVWHAQGLLDGRLEQHHRHFSVGLAVGSPGCSIPTGGIDWRPLPPPVLLDEWAPATDASLDRFTTVASWRGTFGRLEHAGRTYGAKAHQLRRLLDLPTALPVPIEIALDIHPGDHRDLESLRRHGWNVVDPRQVVPDGEAYRRYVHGSGGELSVAQEVYVETRSGWISDRTVRYLAAGRPALVQDTGLPRSLPSGEGLLVFRTRREAIDGALRIARDYASHRRRARELAEACFDSRRVLPSFLEQSEIAA